MYNVDDLKNKRSQAEAKLKKIVTTVDHIKWKQQEMGQRKGKHKSENIDKEVEAKRTRHDEKEDIDVDEESEESKESKEDDDDASVKTPNGVNKYSFRGYKNEMAGMDILYGQTVRSKHERLYKTGEEKAFIDKSTAACPTYGVCYWCFGSGPMNMYCQVRKTTEHTYKTFLTGDWTIIDAEWVSNFFGTTH
jgi:hypothetical protein